MEKEKKVKLKIPEYAINPLFKTILFNWMFVLLRQIVPENNINVYSVYNNNYKKVRKEKGKYAAFRDLQRIVQFCNKIKGVLFVADYEDYQIFVVSEADISEVLLNEFNDGDDIGIRIGATASRKDDNAFTIVDRCIKATDLSHKMKSGFQTL